MVKLLKIYVSVRQCTRQSNFITYASKPNFKRAIVIDDGLVAALLSKESICLNRPVYIGQAVLDLSKLRMYRLQYEDLERYRTMFPGSEIRILAGDTDSFFLGVKGIDLKSELLPAMMRDTLLDTSNYPPNSVIYSKQFENKIGLIKDESGGVIDYMEWLFLRPKCYSLLSNDNTSTHKAKGITRATRLTHDQYRTVYASFNPQASSSQASPICINADQHNIISHIHQLYTVSYKKRALSIMDDKRMWIARNLSLPYGHYSL